jgi:hypothetical protein
MVLAGTQLRQVKNVRDGFREQGAELTLDFVRIGIAAITEILIDSGIRTIEDACTRLAMANENVTQFSFEIAKNSTSSMDEVRSFSAVVAAVGFRRSGELAKSREALSFLHSLRSPWEDAEAFALHLDSLTYTAGSFEEKLIGLRKSEMANEQLPGNPGFMHALAEFKLESVLWGNSDVTDEDGLLNECLRLVDKSIALQDWPKFHFTRARILLRKARTHSDFEYGLRGLDEAISKEATSMTDAQERRSRYQFERSMAELRWNTVRLEDRTKANIAESVLEAKESLALEAKKGQVQAISLVAFITSLIALLQFSVALFVVAEKAGESANVSYAYLLATLLIMAFLLFGSVFIGIHLLNRGYRQFEFKVNGQASSNLR